MKRKPKANTVQYTVSLKGLPTPKGTITFSALKSIIDILSEGSERALRLALEGESVKRGIVPTWLSVCQFEFQPDFLLSAWLMARGVKRRNISLLMFRLQVLPH